eukprot:Gregarina_sp_Pseudo_9__4517@NODE_468_length_2774_cov_23_385375_g444_i0_p1_GENE_NODE_468_length_2774_cov_23_385375_g444_i0NODE_468_length_2774_cov_23_385375_g444_i0_p1_ORF_typecomplete_len864_score117_86_NODE_468_length_2774_cov_23_385375_g444_i0732664
MSDASSVAGKPSDALVLRIPTLPLLPLFRLFSFLPLEKVVQLGRLNKELFDIITRSWCPETIVWTYDLRQKLRRQIFVNPHDISLPSHFTHIFNGNPRRDILRNVLFGPRSSGGCPRLRNLVHHRSSKSLKLHHPYFYRQLPLAITPNSVLSGPVLNPEDIPLPHDLSLLDIFHLLLSNYQSLESVDIHSFDTSPLPWNSTPSRVCPRDILPKCCYQSASPSGAQSVCVWCPDCKPAQHEHNECWRAAGELVIERLLKQGDAATSATLERGLSGGVGPVFEELRTLRFKGWGVTNFMAVLRLFGCAAFPKLETLELSGTVIMAPALTDTKDAEPRPHLNLESLALNQCPLERSEQAEKLMQILSFHISPFARYANLITPRAARSAVSTAESSGSRNSARLMYTSDCRRYKDQAVKEYWMGHFNGQLWRAQGFPKLRMLSLRVGNFDDACRWITPMMTNCFARCPELRALELDHTVLHPMRPDNPILKLFSLCQQDSSFFPKLRFLLLRSVESPLQLAQIQRQVSEFVRRPIIVKTRKLFLRLASERAVEEAALVRHWAELQRQRLQAWINKHSHFISDAELKELTSLTTEELSIFNSNNDGSAMLMLNFDATQDPGRYRPAEEMPPPQPPTGNSQPMSFLCYGAQVAKLQLKQFTPTNPEHSILLSRVRLCDLVNEQLEDLRPLFEECAPELVVNNAKGTRDVDFGLRQGIRRASSLTMASTNAGDEMSTEESFFPLNPLPELIPRKTPLRRVTIQFDLPQIWQHTPEQAKVAVTTEVATLRNLIQSHPDLRDVDEARVMSCTRLTYGGSNWPWWEELICGKVRRRVRQVGSGGWVRESSEILNEEELRVFKCSHVMTRPGLV